VFEGPLHTGAGQATEKSFVPVGKTREKRGELNPSKFTSFTPKQSSGLGVYSKVVGLSRKVVRWALLEME
jgi:hypothetical protein